MTDKPKVTPAVVITPGGKKPATKPSDPLFPGTLPAETSSDAKPEQGLPGTPDNSLPPPVEPVAPDSPPSVPPIATAPDQPPSAPPRPDNTLPVPPVRPGNELPPELAPDNSLPGTPTQLPAPGTPSTLPDFNPSGSPVVAEIKRRTDELIGYLNSNVPANRERAIAITNYEQAAMWAVKANFTAQPK